MVSFLSMPVLAQAPVLLYYPQLPTTFLDMRTLPSMLKSTGFFANLPAVMDVVPLHNGPSPETKE